MERKRAVLLQEFLDESVERDADKTALVRGEERLSYADVGCWANRIGRALGDLGLEKHGRAIILMQNTREAALSIWGVLRAGGAFVVLSPTLKPQGLAYIVNDCAASVVVTDAKHWPVVREALASCPSVRGLLTVGEILDEEIPPAVRRIAWDEVGAFSDAEHPRRAIDLDLAALVYTSGSTGRPKGVMEPHLNLCSVTRTIARYLSNRSDDVLAGILPLNSGYGLSQMLTAFLVGGTYVLQEWAAFPFPMVRTMREEGVTGLAGVPTLFATLLKLDGFTQEGLPALRYLTNAGAGISVPRIRELRAAFPNVDLFCMYGLTECQRVTYLEPADVDLRPETVGKGMPNQEHWIVDESGNRVGPDVVGELVVRGSHIMRGYWNLPEETAARFRYDPVTGETVLYSGDLFRMDGEGYLQFVSRMDDIIKCKGQKVSPKEVEDVLCELPEVEEAAVVPAEDPLLGEAIHAHIVLRDGRELDKRQVLRHCAQRLEDFKVPHAVHFHDAFKKGATGKIDKQALRAYSGRTNPGSPAD